MNKRESCIHRFLKKCENPPKESFLWFFLNFVFNYSLFTIGKVVISKYSESKNHSYILMSSLNMGDLLFLYRTIDDLERGNGFFHSIILADSVFCKPLEALRVEHFEILPFWKIMVMDKAAQLKPNKYSNIVVSSPWYFFGTGNNSMKANRRQLPYSVSAKTIETVFFSKGMKNNTVILSPYEQTITLYGLKLLPWGFWVELAKLLNEHGFYVMTNANGKTEKIIEGTKQFFPPLAELAGAAKYAGYCISMRSGFADWLSSVELKKEIVLYPSQKYYNYYNLNMLWNKKSVYEYIYGESDVDSNLLAQTIIDYIIDK